MQTKTLKIFSLFFIIFALALLSVSFRNGLNRRDEQQKQARILMDTYCAIQAQGSGNTLKIIGKALDRIEEIDKKFNSLNPVSPLFGFNEENSPVTDREICQLIRTALKISEKSGGAFDITVEPLVRLWGFYNKTPSVPGKGRIIECLKKTGYGHLAIKEGRLEKLNKSVRVDLGAIAKGYAVGEALKILKNAGIKSALIDLGGDIYALGKLEGKPWKVGIRNPDGKGILGMVEVSDLSLSTSGSYERFFEKDGIRYHHIFDPKTGYPARGLKSVTVICPDPVLADALSTTIFVLGREKGLEFAKKAGKAEAMVVTDKGEISFSSGFKKLFKK